MVAESGLAAGGGGGGRQQKQSEVSKALQASEREVRSEQFRTQA